MKSTIDWGSCVLNLAKCDAQRLVGYGSKEGNSEWGKKSRVDLIIKKIM